jgi:mono/diheme cytochrome c family protein
MSTETTASKSLEPFPTASHSSSKGRRVFLAVQVLIGGALVLLACSSRDGATESIGAPTTVADTNSPAETTTNEVSGVSFDREVRPVLEQNCASCHQSGGPGAAHLTLETAGDAQDNALYIASAVDVGYMPPWPAADGDLAFEHDRRLSDNDRKTVRDWLDDGGSLDVPRERAVTPTAQALVPIERDTVMTGAPYQGSSAKRDDYRCQIYDPELDGSQFLQGFGFEADRTEVVHHALLFRAKSETREQSEALDAEDPNVGWPCTGATGIVGQNEAVKQIMSWAPGQDPTILPADTGIPMEPGDYFITQIHYHYEPQTDGLAPDESTVVADFASDEVIAAAGGELEPIDLTLYLGPAEIPCSTDETGPLCDRAAAQQYLIERSGPAAGFAADGLMAQCGTTAADYAGMVDGTASSSCDLPAHPGQIVSVWGHMHELGSSFRLTLNPGQPDETVLLDIAKWDFDWQLNYSPTADVVLDADDVIRVECSWDRSFLDPDAEPGYVMWAEGTEDEMCYSQIVTRPAHGSGS